jgi:phage recombination protein Bet
MSNQTGTNEVSLSKIETSLISYAVNGEEVKLSGEIVKKYLARGNSTVTDQEIVMFMNLCKFQKLNPFLNEAYLIKFGSDAQIVVGKEAFMKRAEMCEEYEGFTAGIIVQRDEQILELEGCFKLSTDKLVGGWAKVYRKDKKFPYTAMLEFSEYDKKQSLWKDKPSTMIRKTALVQALREAFPQALGSMYTESEVNIPDNYKIVDDEIKQNANKQIVDITHEGEVKYKNDVPALEKKPQTKVVQESSDQTSGCDF